MGRSRKLKRWKITYFTGDFFSSSGEQMHTTTVLAQTEEEAEQIFTYMFGRDGHLAMVEEFHNGDKT